MLEIKSDELYSCPYCGSGRLDGGDVDFESWVREVKCIDCGRTWEERLKVYEIAIPDEYEGVYKIAHPIVIVEKPYRVTMSHYFNPQPKPEKGRKK